MIDDSPLLMVVPKDRHLSEAEAARLKMHLERHREQQMPIVFGFPANIYRFVDGKWEVLPELSGEELEQLQITAEKQDETDPQVVADC